MAGRSEPKVLSVKVDVTDEHSVSEAIRAVSTKFDSLDFVVNNAGILTGYAAILALEPAK